MAIVRQATEIVKGVRQSEKGGRVSAYDQYLIDVAPEANKIQIREAVEELFGVTVTKVNTMNYQGKWRRLQSQSGRRASWKKAVVTVAKGQKIEVKA